MFDKKFKYRFLIDANGKKREVFVIGTSAVEAERRLQITLEYDNEKNNRNTRLIKFIGI